MSIDQMRSLVTNVALTK